MNDQAKSLWLWVLEDNSDIRSVIAFLGESEGFTVLQMSNLQAARNLLRESVYSRRIPHVILSDFNLPDGDAEQFLLACRGFFPFTPIYCLSASIDRAQEELLKQYGIVVARKPLTLGELLRMIKGP